MKENPPLVFGVLRTARLFTNCRFLLATAAASCLLSGAASAATNTWNGAGVGANTGSNWDNLANYAGSPAFSSANILDFSTITATPIPLNLSASASGTIAASNVVFSSTASSTMTTRELININGNGTVGATTLAVSGNFILPAPNGSIARFGSDLIINLSNASHQITYGQNVNINAAVPNPGVLVFDSQITGGGASANIFPLFSSYGITGTTGIATTPSTVFTNNANTFVSSFTAGGSLNYTSIANINGGASALGAATSTTNIIGLSGGAKFAYIGSGDQSTDRTIQFGGVGTSNHAINNYASTPSNLSITGTFINLGSGTAVLTTNLQIGVSSGNTLTLASAFTNGSGTATLGAIAKLGYSSYYDTKGNLAYGNGDGTLVLKAANTYSGLTTISAGTIQVGDGTAGSLNGGVGTALTFAGKGGLLNVKEVAGAAQGMGTLTFSAGDGNVQSTYGGSGTSSVTFSSLAARAAGATGNFIVSGGTNGATNKIVLTGVTTDSFINSGIYYNGSNFAWNDAAGYVRGINYGTDAGSSTFGATTSVSGTYVQVTGAISAQASGTITTLNIAGNNNVTMATNAILSTSSILKSGNTAGGAVISTGTLRAATSGGELILRADGANDALTINSAITNNSTTSTLTKVGAGTVTFGGANTYSGATTLTAGTLVLGTANTMAGAAGAFTVLGGTLTSTVTSSTLGGNLVVNGGTVTAAGDGTVGSLTLSNSRTLTLTSGVIKFDFTGTTLGSYDQIKSANGALFTLTAGTFDLTSTIPDYSASYTLLSGFSASSTVGALAFTGYDSTNYLVNFDNLGVLSFTAVPEPSTYALLGAGLVLVVAMRRRSRSSLAAKN
ncbi:hypothetical protein BH09VER1_BH09VER1_27600 [soil metagenome]